MSILRKAIALMLVAVMALSLVGCGDTTWIVKANDIVINSGLYIYYQLQGYNEAVYTLAEQDINYYYYHMYGYSLLEEPLNEQTVADYTNQYALDMCKQSVVTEQLFSDLGLELTDDDKAIINAQVTEEWSISSDYYESIGISKSTVERVRTCAYMEEMVFDAYYEVGGIEGTTEETIEAYLADEYARIKFMTFNYAESADDAVDTARKDEQLALANSYLERANAGEAMDDLIADYSAYLEASESETAEESVESDESEVSEEVEVTEEEELYENEYIIALDSTSPSEKFVSYVFSSCNVGEFTVIQDDTNFYLVERLDILERDDVLVDSRDYLLSEIYDADYTSLINETLAGYTVTVNEKSVKRYTAENAIMGRDHE